MSDEKRDSAPRQLEAETETSPATVNAVGATAVALTQFEDQVLALASLGGRVDTVANLLSNGETTVIEEARDSIIAKFGVPNMAAAVNQAILRGNLEIKLDSRQKSHISDEKRKILELFAEGKPNNAIQSALEEMRGKTLNRETVKSITRNLFKRIESRGRTHSVRRAYELGIFERPT